MKKHPLILILALLFVSMPFAQADHHEGEEEETALEEQMSGANKAWRSIRRQIKDPAKNASTLALVAKVKASFTNAVDMTPMLAEERSGEDKEKFVAGFQKAMKRTIGLVGDLEKALKAGDNAKAEEIVAKLNDSRKKGHERFKPEDDD